MMRKAISYGIEAVLQGAKTFYQNKDILTKVDSSLGKDIKLELDKIVENSIITYLKSRTDYSILSEEIGFVPGSNKQFEWILDPLDGSLNINRNIPFYCISLALMKEAIPVGGIIYDLNQNKLYTTHAVGNARMNNKKMKVSKTPKKSEAVIMTGFPSQTNYDTDSLLDFVKKVQEFKKVRLIGSAALSLAYVANGNADAYAENGIKLWDVAAGLALVKAAGGKYTISKPDKDWKVNVYAHNGLLQ